MSSLILRDELGETPIHVAFAKQSNTLAALMPNGHVNLWNWTFAKGNKSSVKHLGRAAVLPNSSGLRPKQLALMTDEGASSMQLDVLASGNGFDSLIRCQLHMNDGTAQITETETLSKHSEGIVSVLIGDKATCLQTRSGVILSESGVPLAEFPEVCPTARVLGDSLFLGLSEAGRFYCNARQIAAGCTSFALGGEFLIYTNLQHEVKFLLLQHSASDNPSSLFFGTAYTQPIPDRQNGQSNDDGKENIYGRRVERGSRIVTVVPSTMSVVLQMPRGNLETISPRPLVLQQVRKALDAKQYKDAFMMCRRHRIDLNFLCDHDSDAFLDDLPVFVEQINDNEHLGLFISGLKWGKPLVQAQRRLRHRTGMRTSLRLCTVHSARLASKGQIFPAKSILFVLGYGTA